MSGSRVHKIDAMAIGTLHDGRVNLFIGGRKYYTFADRGEALEFATAVRRVANDAQKRGREQFKIPLRPSIFVGSADALALARFVEDNVK